MYQVSRPERGQVNPFRESAEAAVLSSRLGGEVQPGGGVTAGDRACTVAAILPRDFDFPSDRIDAWIRAVPVRADEMDAPSRAHLSRPGRSSRSESPRPAILRSPLPLSL